MTNVDDLLRCAEFTAASRCGVNMQLLGSSHVVPRSGMKQRQERLINSPGQMTLLAAGDGSGPGLGSHFDKGTHTRTQQRGEARRSASEPADARLEGK